MAESFLGRGWSFPTAFDFSSQSVVMREGLDDIRESLQIIISTRLGERLMLPKFGSRLSELLFDSPDVTALSNLAIDLRNAIILYEPRIEVETLNISPENLLDGLLEVEIEFIVRSINSRYNLVLPYYLEEGSRT